VRGVVVAILGHAGALLAARSSGVRGRLVAAWLLRQAAVRVDRRKRLAASLLSNLGVVYEELYHQGFTEKLAQAIAAHTVAERCSRSGHPARVTILSNLGAALLERYELDGVPRDLARAAEALDGARDECPAEHPDRGAILLNSAAASNLRLRRLADLDAGRAGVGWCAEAADVLSSEDPVFADAQVLWGQSLHGIAELTGARRDMDAAIDRLTTAVDVAVSIGGDVPHARTALSSALRMRAQRTGRSADLGRAIAELRLAVRETPADHAGQHTTRTASLAVALATRFQRSRQAGDIDVAVSLLEEVTATSHGIRRSPLHHANLAASLMERADSSAARPDDLERAIGLLQELTARDVDPSMAPGLYGALAEALVDQAGTSGGGPDLHGANRAASRAVRAAPEGSPELARLLNVLGDVALAQYDESDRPEDLEAAMDSYARAFQIPAAEPRARIRSALLLAHAAATVSDWARATEAYDRGNRLVPFLLPPDLRLVDGSQLVAELTEAGQDAAAASVGLGRPEEGLVRSELWRGILLGPDRRGRAQWERLQSGHKKTAERLQAITWLLDAAETSRLRIGGSR
jgi:hypothetical protein